MKRLIWLLPVMLIMLMTGCLKDDLTQGTVVLLGTESEVKPIKEVVSDSLLSFVETMNPALVLPTGNTPPDIQGEFVFAPRELYANNGHQPTADDTIRFRFGGDREELEVPAEIQLHAGDTLFLGADTLVLQADSTLHYMATTYYYPEGQHNRLVPCDVYEDGFSLKSGIDAYVMGSGNQFTVYFTVEYDDCQEPSSGVEYTLTRGYILTGTITGEGIENAVMACVNLDAQPNTSSPTVPGSAFQSMVDRIYVYRVKTNGSSNQFGMAVRENWY